MTDAAALDQLAEELKRDHRHIVLAPEDQTVHLQAHLLRLHAVIGYVLELLYL